MQINTSIKPRWQCFTDEFKAHYQTPDESDRHALHLYTLVWLIDHKSSHMNFDNWNLYDINRIYTTNYQLFIEFFILFQEKEQCWSFISYTRIITRSNKL